MRVKLRHDVLHFFELPFRFPVMVNDAVTKLFRPKIRGTESEVDNRLGPTRDSLMCPETDMTRSW